MIVAKEQLLKVGVGVVFIMTVVFDILETTLFSIGIIAPSHSLAARTRSSSFTSSMVSVISCIKSKLVKLSLSGGWYGMSAVSDCYGLLASWI